LISNIGLKKLSPNPIGQVPARLGPNSKVTKTTAATAIQHTAISKIQAHLMCKRVDLQNTKSQNDKPLQTKHRTYTNKQTKQQNPTFKSTLNNERIFLSIWF
jgi:hypothetical protein